MEKKTVLAVVLSALIIMGYQFYMSKYSPAPVGNVAVTAGVVSETLSEPAAKDSAGKIDVLSAGVPEISSLPEKTVTVETDKYIVMLSSKGGSIKGIRLKDYMSLGLDQGFGLIDITNPKRGIFNTEGLLSNKAGVPDFAIKENENEVIFTAKVNGDIELVKKYIVHKSGYLLDLEFYIKNAGDEQLKTGYFINTGADIGIDSDLDKRYIQAVAEAAGKVGKNGGGKDDKPFVKGSVEYAGLQNKYFSVIVKNHVPAGGAIAKKLDDGNVSTAIEIGEFTVLPRSTALHKFSLYAGPTDKKVMAEYGLSSAASGGFLGGISDILLAGLKLFHKIFRNWGVAVILLSVLVNMILFPLSRKSYESMKKMQGVQPHMDKLREEHKDNPQKMNKEMMELYKKHEVNPMGGCLPMLLQIPVFIALYQALMKSLELRGSGFLWVKDLSMPDALPLPFSLPLIGNAVNVLPILMSVGMVFQQKYSTAKGAAQNAQQKQQQQMMVIMPVVFLFVMYNFPSGLVLYWLVNTVLTTFEQRAIMARS